MTSTERQSTLDNVDNEQDEEVENDIDDINEYFFYIDL